MSEVRRILIHVSTIALLGEHVLLVQESKPENHGKWNLPGGHLEVGESLVSGAKREFFEETLVEADLTGLVGIYSGIGRTGYHAIRFVFAATVRTPELARAGDEILAARWWDITEAKLLPDKDLVSPDTIRQIINDASQKAPTPLNLLTENFS